MNSTQHSISRSRASFATSALTTEEGFRWWSFVPSTKQTCIRASYLHMVYHDQSLSLAAVAVSFERRSRKDETGALRENEHGDVPLGRDRSSFAEVSKNMWISLPTTLQGWQRVEDYNWIHDLTWSDLLLMGRKIVCLIYFGTKRLHNIHSFCDNIFMSLEHPSAYRKHDCSRWLEWLLFDFQRGQCLREALWNGIFYSDRSGKTRSSPSSSGRMWSFTARQKRKKNPHSP